MSAGFPFALPDRITTLIERIERGEEVTQKEVDRIATLQALDLVVTGRQFARDCASRDREHSEQMLGDVL